VKTIESKPCSSEIIRFENRSVGSPILICLVAGRKQELWPIVLPYLEEAAGEHYVCVVSPGKYDKALSLVCEAWGWSYLSTKTSDSNLAQSICYLLHREAELIAKIDEDMFVLPGSIDALFLRYRELCNQSAYRPGIVAPMTPLDGLSYRYLLEMLGLLKSFETIFGKAIAHCDKSVIAENLKAALWIWQNTSPLSQTGRLLRSMPERLIHAPIQCSTGMIVFERSFWQEMGYRPIFGRGLMSGHGLGAGSSWICSRALTLSRPVVVTSKVIAGRFSFDHQYEEMKRVFESQPTRFTV
jgi:hypothetical protein